MLLRLREVRVRKRVESVGRPSTTEVLSTGSNWVTIRKAGRSPIVAVGFIILLRERVKDREEEVSRLVKMAVVELRVEQAGVQEVTPLTTD